MQMLSGPLFSQISVKLIEKLEDGSYVIQIDDVEYKALPPNKVRDILKLKADYNLLAPQYDVLKAEHESYKKTSESLILAVKEQSGLEVKKAQDDAAHWKTEFNKEHTMRQDFAKKLGSCSGKIIIWRVCRF